MKSPKFPPGAFALLLRILQQIQPVNPVPLTVWVEAVDREYAIPKFARTTRDRTLQAVKLAALIAGSDATTASLDHALLQRLLVVYQRGRRHHTVIGLLDGLSVACSLAVARGWLAASPFDERFQWPVAPLVDSEPEKGHRRHFTRDQVGRFLRQLDDGAHTWEGWRLRTLGYLYAYSGLRRDEALLLEWEDIALDRSLLQVRPKYVARNGRVSVKTRSSAALVPIAPPLRSVLLSWRIRRRADVSWVFPGVRMRGAWINGTTGKKPSDRIKQAGETVGLRGLTPHTLRHSLSTHLRTVHGLSTEQVQLILRHSDAETQREYLHDEIAELVDMVAGLSFEPQRRRPPA